MAYARKNIQLTTKAELDRATLQSVLRKDKGINIVQTKAFVRLRAAVQSRTTNINSLSSENGIWRKSLNDADSMRDWAKARKVLLAAQKSSLTKQLADFQEHVVTILGALPEYRSWLSSDIESGFQECSRRHMVFAH